MKCLGLKSVRALVDLCLTVFGGLSVDHGTLGSKRICQAGALDEGRRQKAFSPAFRDDPIHQKPNPLPHPSTVLLFQCLLRLFNKIVLSLELCSEGVQKIGASQIESSETHTESTDTHKCTLITPH